MAKNSKRNAKDKEGKDNQSNNNIPEPKGPHFDDTILNDTQRSLQDHIESAKNDGWNEDTRSFFHKNRGTILPFIIFVIIIVAGLVAITMLDTQDNTEEETITESTSTQEQTPTSSEQDSQSTQQPVEATDDSDQTIVVETQNPVEPEPVAEPPPQGVGGQAPDIVEPPAPSEPQAANPERISAYGEQTIEYRTPTQIDDAVYVSAEQGNGITHLARKTLQAWTAKNGITLSAEQLVYAEDYMQNRTGSHQIEVGQTLVFQNSLITEAITAAQNLNDWQIQNLMQYTR